MLEARHVACRLQVRAQVDHVDEHLHVSLRLHAAAHQPERDQWLAILHDEGGDDRVERALARRDDVRAFRIEREQRPAIVQHEAIARHRHA